MDKFVASLNIEHLRKQVAEETDSAKREILLGILGKEEVALALILAKQKSERKIS